MSKINKIITFITIIAIIMITIITAKTSYGDEKGEYAFSLGWKGLKDSNYYYCRDHGRSMVNGGIQKYYVDGPVRDYDSGSADLGYRVIAEIMRRAANDKNNAGYYSYSSNTGTSTGKYQWLYWLWRADYDGGPNVKNECKASIKNEYADIVEYAKNNIVPYSSNNCGLAFVSSNIESTGSAVPVSIIGKEGRIDHIQVTIAKKSDESVLFEVPIYANSNTNSNNVDEKYVELYSNYKKENNGIESFTQPLEVKDINSGTIYFRNVKSDQYIIKNIRFTTKSDGQGCIVSVTNYVSDISDKQRIMTNEVKTGEPSEKEQIIYVTKPEEPATPLGSITVYKEGKGYPADGKSRNIGLKFRVYCSTLGKYVQGEAGGPKNYVNSYNEATVYEYRDTDEVAECKISALVEGYVYEIVEDSVISNNYTKSVDYSKYYIGSNKIVGYKTNVVQNDGTATQIKLTIGTRDGHPALQGIPVNMTKKVNVNGNEITVGRTSVWIENEVTRGDINIIKQDLKSQKALSGAQFRILAEYKGTDGNVKTEWLVKDENGEMAYDSEENLSEYEGIFTTDKDGKIALKCIRLGTYTIYEIKAPEGYELADQDGYMSDEISRTNKWAKLGEIVLNTTNSVQNRTYTNEKTNDGVITLKKQDKDSEEPLVGAGFRIKEATKGWVIINNGNTEYSQNSKDSKGLFTTGSDGQVSIPNLKYGTYSVYEVKAPEGYDLSKQAGYDAKNAWVDFGENAKIVINAENKSAKKLINNEDATGTITIVKQDGTKKLQGAEFKIKEATKGFVVVGANNTISFSNNKNASNSTFTTNKDGIVTTPKLPYGTYYIYEVKAPTGYYLEDQDKYDKANSWVDFGTCVVDKNNKEKTVIIPNNFTSGNIKLIKQDNNTEEKISGAKFRIEAIINNETRWLTINNGVIGYSNNEKDQNGIFTTDQNGEINLPSVRYGQYIFYEVSAPAGYDLTMQEGYGVDDISKKNGWSLAKGVILNGPLNSEEPVNLTVNVGQDKIVKKLEGFVWEDVKSAKNDARNYIYQANDGDKLLEGIIVRICDAQGNTLKNRDGKDLVTKTDKNGKYEFTNIGYYTLMNKGYVEFTYNNKEYVVVPTYVGQDDSINSKAQEQEMTKEELEDEKLTGTEGNNPGKAIAKIDRALMEKYFDKNEFKIQNINLGIMEKYTPEFEVDQYLEYVQIDLNGYSYKYRFGEEVATNSPFVPQVNYLTQYAGKTTGAKWSAYLYPTDIAYNQKNPGKLQVYVVYGINVKNSTTMNDDMVYVEKKLFLTSLTNEINTEQLELDNKSNVSQDEGSKQFAMWNTTDKNNIVSYNVASTDSVFKEGIDSNHFTKTFIQFKLTNDMINNTLAKQLKDSDFEFTPTTTKAIGYHEYLRCDNIWNVEQSIRSYTGEKFNENNKSNKPYFKHKSQLGEASDNDNPVKFKIGQSRKISGVVFEDLAQTEGKNDGNGILEDNERKAEGVKVNLLNEDGSDVYLYSLKADNTCDEKKAEQVLSNSNGEYEFDGVTPGKYIIKFTYGKDGKWKNGENIFITDYTSTPINQALIDAVNNGEQWYTIGEKYSTAQDEYGTQDDKKIRNRLAGAIWNEDGSVELTNGNIIKKEDINKINMEANTAVFGVSIENDTNNIQQAQNGTFKQYNEFKGFNLGLIKLKGALKIDKKVTNIELTNQVGTSIVNGDPANSNSRYLTAIDEQLAKIEIDPTSITGASIKTEYTIDIKNEANQDVILKEIYDQLDTDYTWDSIKIIDSTDWTGPTAKPETKEIEDKDGNKKIIQYVVFSTNNEIVVLDGKTSTIKYTVTGKVIPDNDTSFENAAGVKKVKDASKETIENRLVKAIQVTTLGSKEFIWPTDDTIITIIPSTGADRSNTYVIVGFVALLVSLGGIVLIKKKVIDQK